MEKREKVGGKKLYARAQEGKPSKRCNFANCLLLGLQIITWDTLDKGLWV